MEITAQVIADFRDFYTEFHCAPDWTDSFVARMLCEGDEETGRRWGRYDDGRCSLKKRGMFAYAAHRGVMSKAAKAAIHAGGTPAAPAQVSSKSVGDESISYAVSTPSVDEASGLGDLRSTIYGIEFLRLRKRAGMGPVAV